MGPGWAQKILASCLGLHYVLGLNMEINLDRYFAENCWFSAYGVDLD